MNIPFADALSQMSKYVKFMKKIMRKKKKLDSVRTVSLLENFSAIIQGKLLEKLRDFGSFTIPCVIRERTFKKDLCDLGGQY